MKKVAIIAVFFGIFLLQACAQDATTPEGKDPFLSMQWVLKNPNGPFLEYAESFIGPDKGKYYFLPKSFWVNPEENKELKEILQEKFLKLYLPYSNWVQEISGIENTLFLSVSSRESAWATSERWARSGGELFSIKLKDFQKSLGYKEGIKFKDDSKEDMFVKLWFGRKNTTLESYKLFLLSITQEHYIKRLRDGGKSISLKVLRWKLGDYSPSKATILYSAEVYIDCLCGYTSFNWATDCSGYASKFVKMRKLLKSNTEN